MELPDLDDRTYADFVADARAAIPSLAPAWTDHNPSDPGIVLIELFAWLAEIVLYRLGRVPERSYRVFLDLLRGSLASDRDPDPSVSSDPLAALPLDAAIRSVVAELRDRHRAITTDDVEYLALQRWPTLAAAQAMGVPGVVRRALCIAEHSPASLANRWRPGARTDAGHLTLVVVTDSLGAARLDLPAFDPARRWALELDGEAAYADAGADDSLAVTGALTVAAWIFPRTLVGAQGIVCKAAAGEYELVLEPDGALAFRHADGIDGGASPAGAVPIGRWSHVAAVRAADGASVTLFVDGQPVATQPLARAPAATAQSVSIGRRSAGAGWFDGFIRDVTIWNVARTAAELAGDLRHPAFGLEQLAAGASPPPGLVASWRFDDPGAGPSFDEGGGMLRRNFRAYSTTTLAFDMLESFPQVLGLVAVPPMLQPRDATLHRAAFHDMVRPLEVTQQLLAQLALLLDEWRLLTTRVDVIGYTPLRVTVSAHLYLRPDADIAAVRAAASAELDRFLDPLAGWRGAGWPFGRAIYQSDLQAVLDAIAGVDFVTGVQIALADPAQREAVAAGTRPPPPDEDGAPIGVALQPDELPGFERTGTILTLYQREGTQWQTR